MASPMAAEGYLIKTDPGLPDSLGWKGPAQYSLNMGKPFCGISQDTARSGSAFNGFMLYDRAMQMQVRDGGTLLFVVAEAHFFVEQPGGYHDAGIHFMRLVLDDDGNAGESRGIWHRGTESAVEAWLQK